MTVGASSGWAQRPARPAVSGTLRHRRTTLTVLVLMAISAGSAAPATAALAPAYDRMRQFAAVIENGAVAEALEKHGLIMRIERNGDGSFQVWAGECSVRVELEAVPPAAGMVGPNRYTARPGPVTCP